VKNILCYTLTFSTKAILIERLRTLIQDLTNNPRAIVSRHTKLHTAEVSLLRCLNTIYADLSGGDKKCIRFLNGIGHMNEEGFFEEANFLKVCFTSLKILFLQLYGTAWPALRDTALSCWAKIGKSKKPEGWSEKVLVPFTKALDVKDPYGKQVCSLFLVFFSLSFRWSTTE
jgi:hypothetical protein